MNVSYAGDGSVVELVILDAVKAELQQQPKYCTCCLRPCSYIWAMEMEEDATHTMPRRVLEEPYPLGNPFVFEHGEQLFLIPELVAWSRGLLRKVLRGTFLDRELMEPLSVKLIARKLQEFEAASTHMNPGCGRS